MDVKFIKVAAANLSTVPIVDGQVIVCTDSDDMYYDMGTTRHRASSLGNSSNYGLVKLSDNYSSSAGAASASVRASSKAVADLSRCVPFVLDVCNYCGITCNTSAYTSTATLKWFKLNTQCAYNTDTTALTLNLITGKIVISSAVPGNGNYSIAQFSSVPYSGAWPNTLQYGFMVNHSTQATFPVFVGLSATLPTVLTRAAVPTGTYYLNLTAWSVY